MRIFPHSPWGSLPEDSSFVAKTKETFVLTRIEKFKNIFSSEPIMMGKWSPFERPTNLEDLINSDVSLQ